MRTKRKSSRRSKPHIALVKAGRRRRVRSRTQNVAKNAARKRRALARRLSA